MDPTRWLRGPAPSWPRALDAALEGWARLSARLRAVLGGAALALLLVAAGGGLLEGPWGPPVDVLVATRGLEPGTPVGPGDVVVARRPADTLPQAALSVGGLPDGAVATGHVAAGAVLAAGHVLAGGPSALVPRGRALVPVPADLLPPLPPGVRLRVVAPDFGGSAVTVAADAVLVADDGTSRWLAVAEQDVAGVAAAVGRGSVVVGVLGPDP